MIKAAKYGGIVGDDFAGIVEELGPDVPEGMWSVGERVAGLVFGSQFFPFAHFRCALHPVVSAKPQPISPTAHSQNT
jgi:NADPH:quinone reductase-like Zn-dependent oxidoreductase